MNLSQLKLSDLKVIEQMLREKEDLQAKLEKINAQLAAFGSEPAPVKPSAPAEPPAPAPRAPKAPRRADRAPRAKRRPPGELKERIMALLQQAGKSGITVREIASRLGLHPQRIFVWFNATGKSLKGIKKVAPATYAWNG